MLRLGLMLVAAALAVLSFPESRRMLVDAAEPLLRPVEREAAEEEMTRVGRNVVDYERLTGALPDAAAWVDWLEERYATDEPRTDPWGSLYQLSVWQDSVGILSYGPDRTAETEDDFFVVTRRE